MNAYRTIGALLALGLHATGAHANLLTNGSFELPGGGCRGAVATLAGWSVTSGNIDQIDATCSQIVAADGSFLLDLTGTGEAGTIAQSFATTAGTSYDVSFYFGGNAQWQYLAYGNDSPFKSMNALIDGVVMGTYSIDTTGLAYSDAGWVQKNFQFTATSSSTTLSFASLNASGVFGPLLDGVVVEAVKVSEPGSLALAALTIGGLGLTRRRRGRA